MSTTPTERVDDKLFNSTEHPVSWFRDNYRSGALRIKPPYQRKPVWSPKQKCRLIESILLGMPIPEIYIQHTVIGDEDETSFAVVDGQQRIRTLVQFIGVEYDPAEVQHNKFPLDELDEESAWFGLRFEKLSPDDRKRLLLYRFGVRYLNTEDDRLVRNIFERLNAFTTPLSPQEVRNARYTGPFVELVTALADSEYWIENRITTPAMIRRMKDIEYMSELIIGILNGPQKGSASAIDEFYQQYGTYDEEFPDQKRAEQYFNTALGVIQACLPDVRATRWQNRTDFYTLFVCIASLVQDSLQPHDEAALAKAILAFGKDVDELRAEKLKRPSKMVRLYLNAAEKGANDKKRRADRHTALLSIIKPFFISRTTSKKTAK